jgi:hypothetical protein
MDRNIAQQRRALLRRTGTDASVDADAEEVCYSSYFHTHTYMYLFVYFNIHISYTLY